MRRFIDHSGLLIAGALLALVWANSAPHSYEAVAEGLRFAVNDVAMAFFFALAAKEIVEAKKGWGFGASPVIADGRVYAADLNGRVYAFEMK